jgi:hypothetical protein
MNKVPNQNSNHQEKDQQQVLSEQALAEEYAIRPTPTIVRWFGMEGYLFLKGLRTNPLSMIGMLIMAVCDGGYLCSNNSSSFACG